MLAILQDALNLGFFTLNKTDPHPLSLAWMLLPLAWREAIYRAGPVTVEKSPTLPVSSS